MPGSRVESGIPFLKYQGDRRGKPFMVRAEFRELNSFLRRNSTPILVIGSALLFMLLKEYHPIANYWASSLVYYFILPVFFILVFLRKNPLDFGLRPGNWRVWLVHLGMAALISLPVLYIGSRFTSLDEYYAFEELGLLFYFLETLVYMLGWEFICRGYLLFGLKEKFGELSILIQLIPFVMLHFGKPEIETLSTIITGIIFGYIAYRGNSFWPAFLLHVFINIIFRVMVNYL